MQNKIQIGISACLLGQEVRFDGGHKKDKYITNELSTYFQFIPFCPEVEIGLPVPRPTIRLTGDSKDPELVNPKTGEVYTEQMKSYSLHIVEKLRKYQVSGYIVKRDSPSCGMERVRVYKKDDIPVRDGIGIFTRVLMDQMPLLPIEEEGRLKDEKIRENFITRVFAFNELQQFALSNPGPGDLVDFHSRFKLLLMAYSQIAYRNLGRLVANSNKRQFNDVLAEYYTLFMNALKTISQRKNQANVLYHVMGYFKKTLQPDEKSELINILESYRNGYIPVIVPLTLINHYRKKNPHPWLDKQFYFQPYPQTLKLRNTV
ncbi:MAG: DUF523 and DUF1722 domain-containing protein [Calditrichia bacterium]